MALAPAGKGKIMDTRNSRFDLSEELIVITGGTGVIGTAFAEALLEAGARIVLWSRGKTISLDEAVERIEQKTGISGRTFGYPIDVADPASVEDGFGRVVQDIGVPGVLINGAGGNRGKSSFIDADLEVFEEVIRLNLLGGLMIPTQIFTRYWIKKGVQASIINVASAASYIPLSGVWAYDAAKSAVMNLTMAGAKEFASSGIRVNGIAPGFFIGHQNRDLLYSNYSAGELSPRGQAVIDHTPYGRFGEMDDLFGTVVFLASRKASGFITGVTIPLDGGYLIHNI